MPGFVESTVYTGYGYLDPYVTPYVEKARNNVPLIDRAAKGAEEVVPSLITRVDEFTEPRIEKLRPIVEPRIEQVKEIATPYVDSGVKRYEAVKTESCKYYSQAMEYKNSKASQAMEYKKSKVDLVQNTMEAKISWCKKTLCNKGDQVNQLFRVPATDNLEGMKFQGVMGKMAALLDKVEGLVDKYLPALPKKTPTSPKSEYDDSYLLPRMFLLVVSVKMRLVYASKSKCDVAMLSCKSKFEKIKCGIEQQTTSFATTAQKKIKAVVEPKFEQLKAVVQPKVEQMKGKIAPKVVELKKSKQYNQACQMASKGLTFSVQTCEKVIGKEKTQSLIKAVEARMPACCKAAPPAAPKKMK